MSRKSMIVFKLKKSLNDIFSFNHSSRKGTCRNAGAFLMQSGNKGRVLIMGDSKTLYCPRCNRKLGTQDGNSKMEKTIKCSKCLRLFVFKNGKHIATRDIPKRNTASGMTFR